MSRELNWKTESPLDIAQSLEDSIRYDSPCSDFTIEDAATHLRRLHAEVLECREKIAKLDTASSETSKTPMSCQS